jgi:type VI secretion system protein VasG
MLELDIKGLVRRLNRYTKKSLESAAGLCISRGHYEVTAEHLLLQFLEDPEADVLKIFRHYGISPARPLAAVQHALDRLRGGNSGRPVFSPNLLEWIGDAWMMASVEHQDTAVRSGTLLLVLALRPDRYASTDLSEFLEGIKRDELRRDLYRICAGSREAEAPVDASGAPSTGAPGRPAEETAIGKFTVDLTERARRGEIDPVFGRDREIRAMIDILARRRKNNPIVVGEPGTGKTAVVEGLALRIVKGDVPDVLKNVRLISLDLGLLQAGAGVRGEFENRLKGVISEVKASPIPIVTFIDEAHTLIGAGGTAGGSDAANLLKPALARGELRTIAATTWSEYKKYFEKDAALERRFQVVKIDEPTEEAAILMMRGLRDRYESAHGVRIREEAVEAAARLSSRYISGRQLPDKAVDLMDTASARVKIARVTIPELVDDLDRKLQELDRERDSLRREESLAGSSDPERLAALQLENEQVRADRVRLVEKWEREKLAVEEVLVLRARLEGGASPAPAPVEAEAKGVAAKAAVAAAGTGAATAVAGVEAKGAGAKEAGAGAGATAGAEAAAATAATTPPAPVPLTPEEQVALRAELMQALARLKETQGAVPLVPLDVDASVVAAVVSGWTGIPVGKMVSDEAAAVLQFRDRMAERIKGQDQALDAVDRGMRAARAGLKNPQTPIGVFLFVGPSGVGKTETALTVADLMFGGDRFTTTINMSEFQEKHTVSRLLGSPPGYVGYGEGGVLTEAVRQKPYSVVLLDEVEKADPEVMNIFYQVFDKGMAADGEGRIIDFKNTVIFLTSNLATDVIMQMCTGPVPPTVDEVKNAIRPILSKHFKPALLGRMEIVPFYPLAGDFLKSIIRLKLKKIVGRMQDSHRMRLDVDEKVVDLIAERCQDPDSGARVIDHIVNQNLLPLLSTSLLERMSEGPLPDSVAVGVGDADGFSITFGG